MLLLKCKRKKNALFISERGKHVVVTISSFVFIAASRRPTKKKRSNLYQNRWISFSWFRLKFKMIVAYVHFVQFLLPIDIRFSLHVAKVKKIVIIEFFQSFFQRSRELAQIPTNSIHEIFFIGMFFNMNSKSDAIFGTFDPLS